MPDRRPDLRLDAPTLEPSDDFVFRLAMAARSNSSTAPTRSRARRLALVLGSFLGVSVISVGGAWAVGAIDVPLLPPSPLRDAVVTPREPAPQERQDGAPAGGEPDPAPVGKAVGSSGDDPTADEAGASEPEGRSLAEPAPKNHGGDGRTGAPVDRPTATDRGQGETRSQDKGDNGQHRGQDKGNDGNNGNSGNSGNGASEQARERGQGNGSDAEKPAKPEKDKKAQDGDE